MKPFYNSRFNTNKKLLAEVPFKIASAWLQGKQYVGYNCGQEVEQVNFD